MTQRIAELRKKKAEAVYGAEQLLQKHPDGKLPEEQERQYSAFIEEARDLTKQIQRFEEVEGLRSEVNATPAAGPAAAADPGVDEERARNERAEKRSAAFQKWIAAGRQELSAEERAALVPTKEERALQGDLDTKGGFVTAPPAYFQEFIKGVDDETFIRRRGRVITLDSSESGIWPSLESDPDDAEWTTELSTGSEDDAMAFGQRKLEAHPLSKRIKLSEDMLQHASFLEGFVRERLAYKFGITEEKAYLTGDGNKKPLGVYTASADGVPTSRDVDSVGSTAVAPDDIWNMIYNLKIGHRRRARWNGSRDFIKAVRKLKDNDNRYLWQDGLAAGQPDTLGGLPFDESEYSPSSFVADAYVAVLANWNWYWILDAKQMTMKRLVELYAETNQIGLIGRRRLDGAPVLAEAFTRLKLKA